MQQGRWCLKLSLIFSMMALLSACQPPVSGESAGIQTPYLSWKLQQTELAATPLQIPVKGVNIGQIFVHDKFHRTLILSGFCFLKIAKISLNSSFFPKPIKR